MRAPRLSGEATTQSLASLHAPMIVTNPVMLPESELIAWGRQFLRPDGVFVDAGAHVGSYALCYAPSCWEVWAFECQRDIYYRLCAGIVLNAYSNVFAIHGALVDPEARARHDRTNVYRFSADGGATTTIPEAIEHVGLALRHVDTAPTYTIDQFALQAVSLIKIDVEGSELAVLRGAEQTLGLCRPHVLYEVNPDNAWHRQQDEKVAAWLEAHRYRVTTIAISYNMRLAVPV